MPEEATSVFEAVLRRDRVVVVAALVLVIALSWAWIAIGAGTGMSAIDMTRMPRDMMMTPAIWTPAYAALMFLMWWVMMVAMMLPSAAPVLLIFARISRQGSVAKRPWTPTGCFAAGYLAVWAGFSAGGHGPAVGVGRERAAFGHDGDDCDLARRGDTDRCRPVAVCAAQTGLPALLPLADRLSYRALAWRKRWRVPYGAGTRDTLPGMLLVPDGAAVLRRRHEPLVDRRTRSLHLDREGASDGPVAQLRRRYRTGLVGRIPADDRLTVGSPRGR